MWFFEKFCNHGVLRYLCLKTWGFMKLLRKKRTTNETGKGIIWGRNQRERRIGEKTDGEILELCFIGPFFSKSVDT